MPVINKDFRIAGTNCTFNDLCPKELYRSNAGEESPTLNDNISKYDYLVIDYTDTWTTSTHTEIIDVNLIQGAHGTGFQLGCVCNKSGYNGMAFMAAGYIFYGDTQLLMNNGSTPIAMIYFNYYEQNKFQWISDYTFKINRVVGYQYRANYNEIDRTFHQ